MSCTGCRFLANGRCYRDLPQGSSFVVVNAGCFQKSPPDPVPEPVREPFEYTIALGPVVGANSTCEGNSWHGSDRHRYTVSIHTGRGIVDFAVPEDVYRKVVQDWSGSSKANVQVDLRLTRYAPPKKCRVPCLKIPGDTTSPCVCRCHENREPGCSWCNYPLDK
jgi:hypothetical protein